MLLAQFLNYLHVADFAGDSRLYVYKKTVPNPLLVARVTGTVSFLAAKKTRVPPRPKK